jgi:MFS superfamily sulfate permease-like transporter
MLAAIGFILILKQFPHFIGYDADFEGDESFIQPDQENTFSELFNAFRYIEPGALIIGMSAMLILILWETKFFKSIKALQIVPGALVAVIVGALLNEFFKSTQPGLLLEDSHLVSLPEASGATQFFSFFTQPDFTALNNPAVWTTALTIGIVASLETLLGIEAVDKLDPYKRVTPANRELKAQGDREYRFRYVGRIATDLSHRAQLGQRQRRGQVQGFDHSARDHAFGLRRAHPGPAQ